MSFLISCVGLHKAKEIADPGIHFPPKHAAGRRVHASLKRLEAEDADSASLTNDVCACHDTRTGKVYVYNPDRVSTHKAHGRGCHPSSCPQGESTCPSRWLCFGFLEW